ncbi:ERG12 Mevalonate kinase [Pyrenophora tritici-repentis]|uniref:Mevalonate kinase n=1 Tax=Pyrenophora tritici-repentis TaxID=45151 RepID=A0A317AN21_9PLEO|nr:Mevalonate kinase [Pyrenophora tritici-repentis]KAF7451936.1 Mevalonate kinase [Pyrenophora tritici-repentis]KAF7574940.1 ERG12, Mevalonate kinase [Pyrenophora tritici-repentis]KAG9386292.1 Mevalonate kinase [Pyrenophora tritici-repentis]KAI0589922.1 Mevalonate kinase [Pyrenophora tritici-repentis]
MAANSSMRRTTLDAPANFHPFTTSSSSHPAQTAIDSMPAQLAANLPPATMSSKNGAPVMLRKQSSPMMPPFMVSAPGKVIVYGEHAVVHGKAAIAAAISLRSYLHVSFLSKSNRTVKLRFPDIQMEHTWDIDQLPWDSFTQPGKKKYYYDLVTSLDPDLMAAIKPFIDEVSAKAPEHIRKIHHASAYSFLYLFMSLASRKVPPCVYTLRSTIPIGAGLGSSASISVCISTALLLQIRALSGPHQDQPPQECELNIERINRWAFVGEMCIHGNPSGVDNTVSSGGKAVLFQRRDYDKPPLVVPLHSFPELPLLLVNTRQSRSTATEVAKVAHLRNVHPALTENILNAIGLVTESAHKLLTSPDFDATSPAALKHLGELVTINHGLLVSLGVSHPKLERIREIIDHTGIGWTKLTGAGGGGCAITILKPQPPALTNGHSHDEPSSDESSEADVDCGSSVISNGTKLKYKILDSLEVKLEQEGFEKFETTLAGDGVGVLWPAVLHNGNEEEGGEEIDQEKFLKAEGNVGIERLVGVSSYRRRTVKEVREGWKFWRPWEVPVR